MDEWKDRSIETWMDSYIKIKKQVGIMDRKKEERWRFGKVDKKNQKCNELKYREMLERG